MFDVNYPSTGALGLGRRQGGWGLFWKFCMRLRCLQVQMWCCSFSKAACASLWVCPTPMVMTACSFKGSMGNFMEVTG